MLTDDDIRCYECDEGSHAKCMGSPCRCRSEECGSQDDPRPEPEPVAWLAELDGEGVSPLYSAHYPLLYLNTGNGPPTGPGIRVTALYGHPPPLAVVTDLETGRIVSGPPNSIPGKLRQG